jgi:hypothetical protein
MRVYGTLCSFILHSVPYTRITGLNKICSHSTENVCNYKHTGTSNVILAKHGLWLPDDGLCKPKHVEAASIILIDLII